MSAQPDLFRQPKRVSDTSIAVYREIAPSLPKREQAVVDALTGRLIPITAYELFALMHQRGTAFDINAVRPRLTALAAKGIVTKVGKRACSVTGKQAYTFRVASLEVSCGE